MIWYIERVVTDELSRNPVVGYELARGTRKEIAVCTLTRDQMEAVEKQPEKFPKHGNNIIFMFIDKFIKIFIGK